jgi:DNA replication and repair protein RecF
VSGNRPDSPYPTLAITHLWLQQFRNYNLAELEVGAAPIVITGRNGSGKTNILEAVSLLSPGRGMRKSRISDMDNLHLQLPWSVSATLLKSGDTHHLASGRDAGRDKDSRSERRIIKINGARERSQSALCNYVAMTWLTPQMDTLFLEGSSARRKLLDRLVYAFDPEHAERVTAYEQAMRERNRLLSEGGVDPHWASVLEQQMAAHSVAIALAREETLTRICEEMQRAKHPFARAEWQLTGAVESIVKEEGAALAAEARIATELRDQRKRDAASGRASIGVHRSHLEVIHSGKQMPAEHCSTGEQKLLLLALLLNHACARASWCSESPILLLDEVVAHLDVEHRKELFDVMLGGGMQTWMTGTDSADFKGLEQAASWVQVDGGIARVIHRA